MGILSLFDLEGKIAMVTGAGSGLGRAMALALGEAGADVSVVDINAEALRKTASEIEKMNRSSLVIEADVTNIGDVNRMVERTVEVFGKMDIAVNNAGISGGGIPAEEIDEEVWKKVMDVNLTSVFWCARAEGRQMMKQQRGKIINTASMSGFIVNKSIPATSYCTAKGGIVMMTKALATEWAKFHINVNAIAPGYFRTPLTQKLWENPDTYKEMVEMTPMGRIGEPPELAGTVVFLASEASNYITGHILVIDGGYTLW